MFTTKGVSEETGGEYIKPGIHNVTITEVTSKESDGVAAPSIFITFAQTDSNQKLNVQFAFSEKGYKFALLKLKHMLTKVVDEATVDAIEGKNVTELAKAYNKILKGKTLNIKFTGKEIAGTSGKRNWWKAEIPIPRKNNPFAETVGTNPTTLVWNEKYDMKALPTASTTPDGATDDLPF